MGAHRSSLLGDRYFGHPGQMLKWMDLSVSPILYTVFELCDIQNLSDCTEMFCQVCKIEGFFLFTNGKMSWMLTGAISLETVLLGTQDKFC